MTLQQSGRVVAFDLETQAHQVERRGRQGAGRSADAARQQAPAGGADRRRWRRVVDPKDGAVGGRLQTGKGAHNFWPKGDGRHWFLSNRVEGTVSLIDTQEMKVVATIRVPGGPDCMDITPTARNCG